MFCFIYEYISVINILYGLMSSQVQFQKTVSRVYNNKELSV